MKLENYNATVEIVPPKTAEITDFLDRAFDYLKDFKSFQNYMENVTGITEEEKDSEIYHTWEVFVEGVDLQWKQKTVADADSRAVRFRLVDGDLEMLEGAWIVGNDESRYTIQLQADFCLGMPVIEEVLGPVLREKLEINSYTMLNSIKEKLEEVTHDEKE
ncbi:MAG: SRPBCC family protein [Thermodesulfobacteriota bacterium]|nr:SRPBCC family protein [Thermodesulfobacteriota bacterium]